jgi:hypothetical protein
MPLTTTLRLQFYLLVLWPLQCLTSCCAVPRILSYASSPTQQPLRSKPTIQNLNAASSVWRALPLPAQRPSAACADVGYAAAAAAAASYNTAAIAVLLCWRTHILHHCMPGTQAGCCADSIVDGWLLQLLHQAAGSS